jgi:MFS family permease
MTSASGRAQRVPAAVLAAAFLFNLGQGVLRPAMPLYLQRTFSANYRMVTLIPVVFGVGKWVANLPSGYLLERLGRLLMVAGLTHSSGSARWAGWAGPCSRRSPRRRW